MIINIIIHRIRYAELVASYLSELQRQGRGPHTVRAYRADLHAYIEYLQETGRPANAVSTRDYLTTLSAFAPASLARRRAAVRGWLGWLGARGRPVGRVEALRSAHVTRPEKTAPSRTDVQAVLAQIPRPADRDQLFFGLLAIVGLRPGEVLGLSLEDFDEAAGTIKVPGWGGQRRRVLVADATMVRRLANWRRTSGRSQGPMFVAPRGGPLRYQTMLARWKQYEAAAAASVPLGDLRLGHAMDLLDAGVPEWVVRDRLGQQSGPLPRPSGGPAEADEMIRTWRATKDSALTGQARSAPDRDDGEPQRGSGGSATA